MDVLLPIFQLLYFVTHFLASLMMSLIDTCNLVLSYFPPYSSPANPRADSTALKKIPRHVALICGEMGARKDLKGLASLVKWSAQFGVQMVSLYEVSGELLVRSSEVLGLLAGDKDFDFQLGFCGRDLDSGCLRAGDSWLDSTHGGGSNGCADCRKTGQVRTASPCALKVPVCENQSDCFDCDKCIPSDDCGSTGDIDDAGDCGKVGDASHGQLSDKYTLKPADNCDFSEFSDCTGSKDCKGMKGEIICSSGGQQSTLGSLGDGGKAEGCFRKTMGPDVYVCSKDQDCKGLDCTRNSGFCDDQDCDSAHYYCVNGGRCTRIARSGDEYGGKATISDDGAKMDDGHSDSYPEIESENDSTREFRPEMVANGGEQAKKMGDNGSGNESEARTIDQDNGTLRQRHGGTNGALTNGGANGAVTNLAGMVQDGNIDQAKKMVNNGSGNESEARTIDQDNGSLKQRIIGANGGYNGGFGRPRITINIMSVIHGREDLAKAAELISTSKYSGTRHVRAEVYTSAKEDPPPKPNKPRQEHTLSGPQCTSRATLTASEITERLVTGSQPDPEVVVIVGGRGGGGATVGFPPWQIRSSEMYFLSRPTYLGLKDVMEAYSGCEQRWGR